MKKLLLLCFAMHMFIAKGVVIVWDGGAVDGQWNSPANWVGDIVPGINDDVFLEGSNYTVQLPAGNSTITIHSLTISPHAGTVITVILPATNTANPGLSVTDALILNNGAVFRNSSGATTGSGITITNGFRINNGARYIHNTSRSNAAIVSQLSTVAGTELGVFEFAVPAGGYTVSLSGRTFGTLELSAPVNSVSYNGNGASPLHIRGDLKLNTKANLSVGMSADLIIDRDLIQSAVSNFDCQNLTNNNLIKVQRNIFSQGTITETGTGSAVIELNGNTAQHISMNITNSVGLRINNSAGAILDASLKLPFKLQLTNGKIKSTVTNLLILADNAVVAGGSSSSFVDGPLKKEGDEDFTFPVGKGQIYAPVRLTGTGNINDQFTIEYIRSNPQSVFGNNYAGSGIDHISYVEYWDISSNTGSAVSKNITLPINCESFCKSVTDLFIASFANSQWTNTGQTATVSSASCSSYLTGTITTGPINEFCHFTLGSNETYAVNPLPINLLSFTAKRVDNKISVEWELAESAHYIQFELERAGKDQKFHPITRTGSVQNRRNYNYTDPVAATPLSYYRLKMVGEDGNMRYSKVVVVQNDNENPQLTCLSPNPISSNLIFSVVSNRKQAVSLVIVDRMGRIVRQSNYQLPAGNSTITVSLENVPPGLYYVAGATDNGKTNVIRFIKH